MKSIQLLGVLICVLVFSQQLPCKITVKFTAKTDKKVKAELVVPSLNIQSEPIIFTGKDQNKDIQINGENCELKPWMIRTFSWEDGKWQAAKNITAKFMGTGWFRCYPVLPEIRYINVRTLLVFTANKTGTLEVINHILNVHSKIQLKYYFKP
uniref:Lipoprotein n=1 Tax=Heterorhabditis bacteriophora TaxID=37862 RepID=A0A1I7XDL4_HETBA